MDATFAYQERRAFRFNRLLESCFYITNLPERIENGPRLLNAYAFPRYFNTPPFKKRPFKVRADHVRLIADHGRLVPEKETRPDPCSQYRESEDEVVITFDLYDCILQDVQPSDQ